MWYCFQCDNACKVDINYNPYLGERPKRCPVNGERVPFSWTSDTKEKWDDEMCRR